jgi:hypothetical protein
MCNKILEKLSETQKIPQKFPTGFEGPEPGEKQGKCETAFAAITGPITRRHRVCAV